MGRQNYQVLATTSQADIATAWIDGDQQINENQELLDEWKPDKKNKFYFYGKKFNIIKREDDGETLICLQGQEVCIARQFTTIWFICFGVAQKKGKKKDKDEKEKEKKEKKKKGFASAPDAFNKIQKAVFDGLMEAGV